MLEEEQGRQFPLNDWNSCVDTQQRISKLLYLLRKTTILPNNLCGALWVDLRANEESLIVKPKKHEARNMH